MAENRFIAPVASVFLLFLAKSVLQCNTNSTSTLFLHYSLSHCFCAEIQKRNASARNKQNQNEWSFYKQKTSVNLLTRQRINCRSSRNNQPLSLRFTNFNS